MLKKSTLTVFLMFHAVRLGRLRAFTFLSVYPLSTSFQAARFVRKSRDWEIVPIDSVRFGFYFFVQTTLFVVIIAPTRDNFWFRRLFFSGFFLFSFAIFSLCYFIFKLDARLAHRRNNPFWFI